MATWIQGNLRPNEKLLALVQPHWLWLITPGRIILYGAIVFLTIKSVFGMRQEFPEAAWGVLAVLVLILAAIFAYNYVEWRTHELAVTDKRIVMKAGILMRKVREMKLNNVESIEVDQSILGRILNYGTVRVHGNGEDVMTLKTVGDPWSIQKAATP